MGLVYCTLVEVIAESPTVRTYRVRPEGGRVEFKPGQFVLFHTLSPEGASEGFRAYSIASSPLEPDLRFTVKIHGKFSTGLSQLPVGSRVAITNPQGHFTFDWNNMDCVFIAGGVGSAPFRSMIKYALEKEYPNKLTLLYMNKSQEEMVYKREFDSLAERNANFSPVYFVTRESEGGHETGRVDGEKLGKSVPNYLECFYYLCGPPEMVVDMKRMLEDAGVPMDRVKLEGWG